VRLPVAVAVVVAALLAAVVAVGLVGSASASRLASGPAVAPPPPTAAPALQYDPGSRAASVGTLRSTLAGSPYTCAPAPQPVRPSLTSAELCAAPVHQDYDAAGSDWTATTGLGVVEPDLVVDGDIKATGDRVFGSLRRQFFDQQTEARRLVAQHTDLAPAGTSIAVSGEVHYTVKGVPSRYDKLLVVVFELEDGRYGAWFSSRPDDASQATLTALDASLATLTAN
jgi:hypothetical protein